MVDNDDVRCMYSFCIIVSACPITRYTEVSHQSIFSVAITYVATFFRNFMLKNLENDDGEYGRLSVLIPCHKYTNQ